MGQSNVAPFKKTEKPAAAKPRARAFLRQYELIEKVKAYQPDADENAIDAAYVFAVMKHGQQMRHSGDPYFAHPVAVAGLLTDLKLDQSTIIAVLLHDVVEDRTQAQETASRSERGRRPVDGVTAPPGWAETHALVRRRTSRSSPDHRTSASRS
jgi:(p)ppGpp synthase/HD superfamily hydrolase